MRLVAGRRARYVVGAGLLMALVTGCVGQPTVVVDAAQLGVAPAARPRLTVNPPDGAAGVAPTEKVTAAVIGGQLTGVLLTGADGAPVAGQLSPDGERWTSSLPLKPATAYTLKAASRAPSGEETTTIARFRTLAPGQDVAGRITPADGGPVPADQVVSVLFDKPIVNRQAVERALRVTANPAATGDPHWKSDRELEWRPRPGWAPGSQVTVSLAIYGKQLGGGLVGAADLRQSFAVVDDNREPALRAANSSAARSGSARPSTSGSTGPAPARPAPSGSAAPGASTFGSPNSAARTPAGSSGRTSASPARTAAPSATPKSGAARSSSSPKPPAAGASSRSGSASAAPGR